MVGKYKAPQEGRAYWPTLRPKLKAVLGMVCAYGSHSYHRGGFPEFPSHPSLL